MRFNSRFCHHLPQDSGPPVLKVEPFLCNWLWCHYMSSDMTLENVRNTELNVVGMLANQRIGPTVRHIVLGVLSQGAALD